MKWRVLVSAPYAMPVIEDYRRQLKAAGCEMIVAAVRERLEEDELLPLVRDIDGLICGDDRVTERVLQAAPRLRVISKWGTGIDSIDQNAAGRHGVVVRNTPNAFSEPVADTVLGYILLFARRLEVMANDMRNGGWRKPQAIALNEATVGVIGVGNCGRAVVRRACAFGMRVLGCDIVGVPADFVEQTGLEVVERDRLLREADFVTLHTTLNATSYHLIDGLALQLMKPTAYLINTSRGPVVDEPALSAALERGVLAGAALDVFEVEPLPVDNPLRRMANCYLAPHNANSSRRAAQEVHERTIANLVAELRRHA